MTSDNNENQNVSLNVPVGVIATGLVLGLASAVYMVMTRNSEETTAGTVVSAAGQVSKGAKGTVRKAAITALIAAIENDATRKLVVAVLRTMAKRS